MSITIERVNRSSAAQASGVVVVIDVIRAFSVASYAFAQGAERILLVRTVDEAHTLREMKTDALLAGTERQLKREMLLAGEVGGRLIDGFSFNNSPSQMAAADVRDRILIQRTGAGTQGAAAAYNATHLLLSALTNAKATAIYARKLAQASDGLITLFPTCSNAEIHGRNEDEICADYLEALIRQQENAFQILSDGIAYLHIIDRFKEFTAGSSDFPIEDVEAVLAPNRFDFAMEGTRKQWRGYYVCGGATGRCIAARIDE